MDSLRRRQVTRGGRTVEVGRCRLEELFQLEHTEHARPLLVVLLRSLSVRLRLPLGLDQVRPVHLSNTVQPSDRTRDLRILVLRSALLLVLPIGAVLVRARLLVVRRWSLGSELGRLSRETSLLLERGRVESREERVGDTETVKVVGPLSPGRERARDRGGQVGQGPSTRTRREIKTDL